MLKDAAVIKDVENVEYESNMKSSRIVNCEWWNHPAFEISASEKGTIIIVQFINFC